MQGLYLLWWVQERHISAALVGAVLAAGDFALLLLEVPTGWFADRIGHRRSLILGSAAQVLGIAACWLGRGVPALAAASVLVAAGDAFRSGADQALLFRTCVALGRGGDFQRLEARTRAGQLGALVALVLAGGLIVTAWGFGAGWAIETILCAIGLAIACLFREPPTAPVVPADAVSFAHAPVGSEANVGALIALTLPAAFLAGAAGAASFLAQTRGGAAPAAIAAQVAVITLAEAAGAALAMHAPAVGARMQYVLLLLSVAAVVTMAAAAPAALVVIATTLSLLLGLAQPLRAAAIQRGIPDDVRARAASVAHACDMAFTMVALPLAGVWRTRRSRR